MWSATLFNQIFVSSYHEKPIYGKKSIIHLITAIIIIIIVDYEMTK